MCVYRSCNVNLHINWPATSSSSSPSTSLDCRFFFFVRIKTLKIWNHTHTHSHTHFYTEKNIIFTLDINNVLLNGEWATAKKPLKNHFHLIMNCGTLTKILVCLLSISCLWYWARLKKSINNFASSRQIKLMCQTLASTQQQQLRNLSIMWLRF